MSALHSDRENLTFPRNVKQLAASSEPTGTENATQRVALRSVELNQIPPAKGLKHEKIFASSTQSTLQISHSTSSFSQQSRAFTIYDESEESGPPLHADSKSGASSHDVSMEMSFGESPMAVDASLEANSQTKTEESSKLLNRSRSEAWLYDEPDYAKKIYKHLRDVESKFLPRANYMRKQPDITHTMRNILVDWLVEVAAEYNLHTETLYLAVNYTDRFLSQMSVLRGKLQLVGTACMFLASKYEEIYPPDVAEFVYITDDTYTKKQVLRMEHLILKVLSFDVAVPTANCFLLYYLRLVEADEKLQCLARYLVELTLIDGARFIKYTPSLIAAASLSLARHTLGKSAWESRLADETGYSINDIRECAKELREAMIEAPSHPQQAVREKYSRPPFHSVSTLEPPAYLP